MKSHLFTMFLFACLICWQSCNNKSAKDKAETDAQSIVQEQIILYGSKTCPHCVAFKAKLDSVGVSYTFKDVYAVNQNNDAEMLEKIQKAGIDGYIELPVIDIEGKILVRPELSAVLEQVD